MQNQEIPKEWYCPITQQIMKNPVIASDGFSYEQHALQNWLNKSDISPMTGSHLPSRNIIPNHALRQTIEHYFQKRQKPIIQAKCQQDRSIDVPNLSCQIDAITDQKDDSKYYISLDIEPPAKPLKKRTPCSIICVIDVSESMDTDSVLGVKNAESHGFSRLDLVKHSLNTMIEFMGDEDQIAFVTFNNSAKLYMPVSKTSHTGKTMIKNRIKHLQASGTTNIWDGLKISLQIHKENQKKPNHQNKNTFIVLLTDGQPNLNPPRGIIPTLKKFITISEIRAPNIHAFGYGYELDSRLLTQIAQTGHGSYTYIPDCSMVGTAFINFMSTALSTVTNQLTLTIDSVTNSGFRQILGFKKQKDNTYNLGVIQYGQNRQIFIQYDKKAPMGGLNNLGKIQINYGPALIRKIEENIPVILKPHDLNKMESQLLRIRYLKLLQKLSAHQKPNFKQNFTFITQFYDQIKKIHEDNQSELTESLLKQLRNDTSEKQGQVAKSFEKQQWFLKWGKHYIPSLYLAHIMQICTNFKDPALQLYAGDQFEKNRMNLDTWFITLPPPKPTAKKQKQIVYKPAPVNMCDYYDEYGGCIYSENQVLLENGSKVKVKNLKRGDRIRNTDGTYCTLKCLVETSVFSFVKMIRIDKLYITPYHPIYYEGSWKFPIDLCGKDGIEQMQMFVETYYSVILEQGIAITCENIECISLAHKIEGDQVAQHQYLGSQKVIEDLMIDPTNFNTGFVKVKQFRRDSKTKRIIGMIVA